MSNQIQGRLRLAATVFISCTVLVGCSDMKVAPVSGSVTLDGQPVPKASVTFHPEAGGRPSFGVTDENGKYRLGYSMNEEGAEVGKCRVVVSTALEQGEYGSGRAKELIPRRYANDEPIIVDVESKSNTIDIALTSDPA
jgi:hypothetical protein